VYNLSKRTQKFANQELLYVFALYLDDMKRIIAKKTLRDFWEKHADAEQYLKTWNETAKNSNWNSLNEIKQTYINASILKDSRIVFNIKGNSYRLIVKFNCERQWAFIRFIGTHAEYDKINADTI
jgi:mRNA interferase HigB